MTEEKLTKKQASFDAFVQEDDPKRKMIRSQVLASGLVFDEKKYEYNDAFVKADTDNPMEVHTTGEMIECLRKNPKIQLEARVIGMSGEDRMIARMNRDQFLEASKRKESKRLRNAMNRLKEWDAFDGGWDSGDGGQIGHDFTPLLGGPFNKQLYYRDYLRMISACFFAYHHDPVARDLVSIMVDFTMGRGFTVHCTGNDAEAAQALWDVFVEVNDFHRQMDYCAMETSIYGENMWWWLPDNNARISFNPVAGEKIPKALIPRIRLIDPSNIAEIITVPEDPVQGVLYYVWMAPTQYQMWTRDNQPSTKFIYTQLPADQIIHEKINSVSNEKRGRSDYFPALGYMKRLRDGVNYSLVAQQKAAAWSIDTTIKGNDEDIDSYVSDQKSQGSVPSAGSEFVHTEAIERKYLSNQSVSKGADSPVFSWCLNMIAMASGIPVSYFGTHLSGGSTRASALVSTEPVAKKFERRRLVYDRLIRKVFNQLMRRFGLDADIEIVFPELITQDRSSKLNDVLKAQNASWISHKRASEIAAKEFDIKDFKYETEQEEVMKDDKALGISPALTNPLTTPGMSGQNNGDQESSSLTAPEKKGIKNNLRTL